MLEKARFWERFAQQSLNARQVKVLNRLLDGFEGELTTSKYAKLTKSSQDTAYRDILELVERGALRKEPRRRGEHELLARHEQREEMTQSRAEYGRGSPSSGWRVLRDASRGRARTWP